MREPDKLAEAESLKRAKNYEAAIAAFELALENVEVPETKTCLSLAQCYVGADKPQQVMDWLIRLTRGGDEFMSWQAAAGILQKLLKSNPELSGQIAKRKGRVWLTGSYTLSQLAPLVQLAALALNVDIEIGVAGYGQHRQDALNPASDMYAFKPDIVVIALHHSDIERTHGTSDPTAIVADISRDTAMIWQAIQQHSTARILSTNIAAPPDEAFGHLAAQVPQSRRALIHATNAELAKLVGQTSGVTMIDADELSSQLGKRVWFDDRYWNLSKQGVSFTCLPLLSRHIASLIAAEYGLSKKCLVLDLDNTCWGGVIGEDGLAGIQIGQSNAKAEAFRAFQLAVKRLQARGVILAVCSKNNDADARASRSRSIRKWCLSLTILPCLSRTGRIRLKT
ncbi:MAG: hypothetical protein R3C04_11015 [Hyphomonas sp.]